MTYAKPPLPPGYPKEHTMPEPTKVVVTSGAKAPRDKAILETPGAGKADIQIVILGWFRQASIRTVRTYLQALVGFIIAGQSGAADAMGVSMPVGDFFQLTVASAGLALAPAVLSFLQNAVEILTKLDRPETRA